MTLGRPSLLLARRQIVLGAAAVMTARAANAATVLTPRQTEGPYYPRSLPVDSDFDLTRYRTSGRAMGDVIDVAGRVYDERGNVQPDTQVEIWHCDANGVYAHVNASGVDPNFQGYGAVRTDRAGDYHFRTVRPGLYTGRTRHIHFRVAVPERVRLTTQMYFPGEPGNARDRLRNQQRGTKRDALIARFEPGDPPRYVFNVVLEA